MTHLAIFKSKFYPAIYQNLHKESGSKLSYITLKNVYLSEYYNYYWYFDTSSQDVNKMVLCLCGLRYILPTINKQILAFVLRCNKKYILELIRDFAVK